MVWADLMLYNPVISGLKTGPGSGIPGLQSLAPMLRKFYFSWSSVVSRAFSAHAHAIRVFDTRASLSTPRLALCEISFL